MAFTRLLFVVLITITIANRSLAQGVKLLTPVADNAVISESSQRTLQSIKKLKYLADVRLMQLNSASLHSDWIAITLPDGSDVQVNRTDGVVESSENLSWIGNVRKGGGEVILSMTDSVITGHVRLPFVGYAIKSIGDNLYVIARIVREMVPPPDPPTGPLTPPPESYPPTSTLQSPSSATARATTPSVVRILVAYTQSASNSLGATGTTAARAVNAAITNLNRAFTNSRVNLRAELAGAINSGFEETGNFRNDLASLRTNPSLTRARESAAADIVILLIGTVTDGDNLCGLAYRNAPAEYAYGIVVAQSLNVYGDCFSHEVAHIFGADHDLRNSDNSPFSFGHGYQYIPTRASNDIECFRTIVAYYFTCPVGNLADENIFSNPDVGVQYYNSGRPVHRVPAGTATAHNARVLNEQGSRVAAFRGTSGPGSSSPGLPSALPQGAATLPLVELILSE